MPTHTPGSLGSAGDDDQGPATSALATQFPNSVDALPGMIAPDLPGGPSINAPTSPFNQAHPSTVRQAAMESANYPVQETVFTTSSEE